jgi:hypothetical protein
MNRSSRYVCRYGTSAGRRPRTSFNQDPPHPIDEVGEQQQIHHLRTGILALEHPTRPDTQCRRGQRRTLATHREIDLKNNETKLPI